MYLIFWAYREKYPWKRDPLRMRLTPGGKFHTVVNTGRSI